MSGPPLVSLSSIAAITQGGRLKLSGNDFVELGFPAYGAGGLNGYLEVAEFNQPAIVLSSIGARCGKCFFVEGEWTSLANTQLIFPDLSRVDPKYLWYQLNDESSWIRSGTAQPFIKPSNVKARLVALPAIDEQRRIATILDKAGALRAKRREAIVKLDQLLQSLFLDMFGDPVSNPKGWPEVHFADLLDRIESGSSPVCLNREREENEWGVLKLGAVTRCAFDASENKALPASAPVDSRLEVREGDLLFSRKNTYELVAACAYVSTTPPKLLLPDLIFRLCLKESAPICPRYLQALLTHPGKRRQVQSLASGSAGSMPNISKARLNAASIEMPPLPLQQQFSFIAEQIEHQKFRLQHCSGRISTLFEILQNRAFSGIL